MKKPELMHIHDLLLEIAKHVDSKWDGAEIEFSEYREKGVLPTSLSENREDHEEAVDLLLSEITSVDESESSRNTQVAAAD